VLAELGFETHALDGSESGLAHLAETASNVGLTIAARQGLMTELPYANATFDYVLAFNVIYHGNRKIVERAITEIQRVLKPSGWYQGTMLSKRDVSRLAGQEISPDTFIGNGSDDKDHPHFYCNAQGLVALFSDFELLSLFDKEHERQGSWHWHLCAERL
jgi:ubiquinone/menaquinone biosynthesis C-methylase UbiE